MPKKPVTSRDYMLFGLRLVGEFGAIIAVPIVLFVLGGQWLDRRLDTGLTFTSLAFLVAAGISAKTIVVKAKKYGAEYQDMINREE